jgi:hypothetical protein
MRATILGLGLYASVALAAALATGEVPVAPQNSISDTEDRRDVDIALETDSTRIEMSDLSTAADLSTLADEQTAKSDRSKRRKRRRPQPLFGNRRKS